MKLSLLIVVCCTAALAANAQVNVTQEHNNTSRDGVYIDAAFTPSAATMLGLQQLWVAASGDMAA
jgi:hypothetical protein